MADTPRFHLSSVMDSELTEFYVKNGFVLVDQLITAKEQEEIRTDLGRSVHRFPTGQTSSYHPGSFANAHPGLLAFQDTVRHVFHHDYHLLAMTLRSGLGILPPVGSTRYVAF